MVVNIRHLLFVRFFLQPTGYMTGNLPHFFLLLLLSFITSQDSGIVGGNTFISERNDLVRQLLDFKFFKLHELLKGSMKRELGQRFMV